VKRERDHIAMTRPDYFLHWSAKNGAGRMLRAYLILLLCQAAGEVLHTVTHIPLSGPIIGMIVLLAALALRGGPSAEFARVGHSTLGYLPLFFIAPGVGVMRHLPLLRAQWLPILVALVASTVLAMISGALVMQSVNRLLRQQARLPATAAVPICEDP
jgi:holin-like protein